MEQEYQSQYTGLEIDQAITNVRNILDNTNGGSDMEVRNKKLTTNDYSDADKAKLDGIIVGTIIANKAITAKQIENVSAESGTYQDAPFRFEATGTDNNTTETATAPVAKHLELRGNTVNWNQFIENGNFANDIDGWTCSNNATISVADNALTLIPTVGSSDVALITNSNKVGIYSSHVYLMKYQVDLSGLSSAPSLIKISTYNDNGNNSVETFNIRLEDLAAGGFIFQVGKTFTSKPSNIAIMLETNTPYAENDRIIFKNIQLFDLSVLYNLSYIWSSKEQRNLMDPTDPHCSLIHFNRNFPLPYYDYNPGELISCSSNKLLTVGYNQFNALDEFIPVVASQTYRLAYNDADELLPVTSGILKEYNGAKEEINSISCAQLSVLNSINSEYPDNGDVGIQLTNNTHYVKIIGAAESQILFNLAWDGSRSNYKEYVKYEYNLPEITLNSIPDYYDQINANGQQVQRVAKYKITGDEAIILHTSGSFRITLPDSVTNACAKVPSTQSSQKSFISGYVTHTTNLFFDHSAYLRYSGNMLFFREDNITKNPDLTHEEKLEQFIKSLKNHPTYLYYPLATPIGITAQSFTENIDVDDFGTMEFINTNSEETILNPIVPQGNRFFFPADYVLLLDDLNTYTNGDVNELITEEKLSNALTTLREKVECLPDLANTNGDYIVHQEGSQMNLTPLIFPPMTAEQFAALLQQVCTIENGFVKFNSQENLT